MNHRHALAWAVLIALSCSSVASAEGWGIPNLNPFAKRGKTPTSGRVSDSGGGFSLLPKWGAKKSRTTGPSTWNRMTTGTKAMFSKTADALTPWDNEEPAAAPPSPTGSFNPFSNASTTNDGEKKSFLPSWTWGESEEEAPKKPKTVNDFLAQPKPEF